MHDMRSSRRTRCRRCTSGCQRKPTHARDVGIATCKLRGMHLTIDMTKVPMTVEGAERLKAELQRLKTVERPTVIAAIAEARSHGDLSENADYDAAQGAAGLHRGPHRRDRAQARQRAGDRPVDARRRRPRRVRRDGGARGRRERRARHLPDRRRRRGRHQARQDLGQLADRARADRQDRGRHRRGADAGRR